MVNTRSSNGSQKGREKKRSSEQVGSKRKGTKKAKDAKKKRNQKVITKPNKHKTKQSIRDNSGKASCASKTTTTPSKTTIREVPNLVTPKQKSGRKLSGKKGHPKR